MTIVNTFAEDGYKVTFDWAWHLANPHLTPIPGQDYGVKAGGDVRAAATGYCSWAQMTDGLFMVSIHYGADNITYRELASVSAAVKTAHITQGAVIGTAAPAGGRSPHWEYDHANGTYSPAENFVTPPTPIIESELHMIFIQRTDTNQIAARDAGMFLPLTTTQVARYTREYGSAALSSALQVTAADWGNIQADALAEAATMVPAVSGVTLAQLNTALAALATTADLPTTGQLGEVLTSTVSLVDAHVDAAFAGLVLKTS